MTTGEQLVMKGLFRLCAGVRASEVYRAASHIEVSVFLTFIRAPFMISHRLSLCSESYRCKINSFFKK